MKTDPAPSPNPPNVPGEPTPAPTLRCTACGHLERCPACDNAHTPPFVLLTHAGDELRREVLVLCQELPSAVAASRDPTAGPLHVVACVYSLGAARPVIGIPVALAYSFEEWASLKAAIARAWRQHAEVFPPELRAAEASAEGGP